MKTAWKVTQVPDSQDIMCCAHASQPGKATATFCPSFTEPAPVPHFGKALCCVRLPVSREVTPLPVTTSPPETLEGRAVAYAQHGNGSQTGGLGGVLSAPDKGHPSLEEHQKYVAGTAQRRAGGRGAAFFRRTALDVIARCRVVRSRRPSSDSLYFHLRGDVPDSSLGTCPSQLFLLWPRFTRLQSHWDSVLMKRPAGLIPSPPRLCHARCGHCSFFLFVFRSHWPLSWGGGTQLSLISFLRGVLFRGVLSIE